MITHHRQQDQQRLNSVSEAACSLIDSAIIPQSNLLKSAEGPPLTAPAPNCMRNSHLPVVVDPRNSCQKDKLSRV